VHVVAACERRLERASLAQRRAQLRPSATRFAWRCVRRLPAGMAAARPRARSWRTTRALRRAEREEKSAAVVWLAELARPASP
jgi:hypothetical protein